MSLDIRLQRCMARFHLRMPGPYALISSSWDINLAQKECGGSVCLDRFFGF